MRCRAPTLIVASAADRLLPSLEESGRLVRVIPNSQRVILPNSGHTALLESGISLARIMDRTGFLPEVLDHIRSYVSSFFRRLFRHFVSPDPGRAYECCSLSPAL